MNDQSKLPPGSPAGETPVATEGARVWHRNLRMYGKVVKDVSLMPKDPTSTLVEFEDGSEREVTTALLSFEPVAQPSPEAAAAIPKGTKPHRFESKIQGAVCSYCDQPWFSSLHPEVAAPIAPAAVYVTPLREQIKQVTNGKLTSKELDNILRVFNDHEEPAASPVAGVSAEKVYRDYIGALRLAYPENPLALNVAEEVHDILCAHPSAEGDGWIAVTEDVPKFGEDVLTYTPPQPRWGHSAKRRVSRITVYSGKTEMVWFDGDINKWITHWRPLPTSPSVQEEKGSRE